MGERTGALDDYLALIERRQIVPCDSESSPLIGRMRDGHASSGGSLLDDEEIGWIRDVIDAPCRH